MYDRQSILSEPVYRWVFIVFLTINIGVIGFVSYIAWQLSQENGTIVIPNLPLTQKTQADTGPVRHVNDLWKVTFDLPAGYVVDENPGDEDGSVHMRILKEIGPSTYSDTTVAVWAGKDSGFNRYYLKPFTQYGEYRRLTAVGRPAIAYADPQNELTALQIIAIDDSHNGREIRVSYSAIQEGGESLALNLIKTLKLAQIEQSQILQKAGWKTYTAPPLSFQYPEDYTADKDLSGLILVKGLGGRIEMVPAIGSPETLPARPYSGAKNTPLQAIPDDFFDINYNITLRIKLFYASDANDYQKSVLQDIAKTIHLSGT